MHQQKLHSSLDRFAPTTRPLLRLQGRKRPQWLNSRHERAMMNCLTLSRILSLAVPSPIIPLVLHKPFKHLSHTGSFSNPNSASVRAMLPVTHGSQTKRHPRKSSSGYFGGGHERSCPSITRRKYSAPLLTEGFVRGAPNSASNISAQTVAFHLGQYTSSPSPQYPAGCCSLRYSATGPQYSIPFRADTTSASLWDLSRISLRVQYRTPGFLLFRSQATA